MDACLRRHFREGGFWFFEIFGSLPEIPVKTGVQVGLLRVRRGSGGALWIPAFAGIFGRAGLGNGVSG